MQNPGDHWHGMAMIGRGANRVCVQAPGDPTRCLKYLLPAAQRSAASPRQRLRRALAAHWPYWDENHLELRAWRQLHQRLGEAELRGRIAACHGLVATPQGQALACERILGHDGTDAPSLYQLLSGSPRHAAEALCAAVDEFEHWLLRHRVPLFDLNSGNLVVVERDGRPRLVCVDAKSVLANKEILPVSRWSERLLRRKLPRRAARLRERIRRALAQESALAAPAPRH